MGFAVPAATAPTTWWWRCGSADGAQLDRALAAVEQALADAGRRDAGRRERGARRAPRRRRRCAAPGPATWRWSRCPGASALVEAMDALDAGRDVMVFSDNVPVEQEIALKPSPPSAACW